MKENNLSPTGLHIHELQYPLQYIIIRLDFTDLLCLRGLEQNGVLLNPSQYSFHISDHQKGQTMDKVIIDIRSTANFPFTSFNVYVAISRARHQDNIRLLRNFKDRLFISKTMEGLQEEDDEDIPTKCAARRSETRCYKCGK